MGTGRRPQSLTLLQSPADTRLFLPSPHNPPSVALDRYSLSINISDSDLIPARDRYNSHLFDQTESSSTPQNQFNERRSEPATPRRSNSNASSRTSVRSRSSSVIARCRALFTSLSVGTNSKAMAATTDTVTASPSSHRSQKRSVLPAVIFPDVVRGERPGLRDVAALIKGGKVYNVIIMVSVEQWPALGIPHTFA